MADSSVLRADMAAAITRATHVSLHTADPTGTGANELIGGNYERVSIVEWNPGATPGTYVATVNGYFTVPANTEITWAGLWDEDVYLDKAPAVASTITADVVEILSLTFVAV